jgi:GNAT superfamily N-acetyltransferase
VFYRYGRAVDQIALTSVDAGSDAAQWAMAQYFAELDERFPNGFDAGEGLEEARQDLNPPHGVFLVALREREVVGCGGLTLLDDTTAEIKRMWVGLSARGAGLGKRLLARLEDEAHAAGIRRVVLDTNRTLNAAQAMYLGAGYVDTERYNDNPYAQRWFAKSLV